MTFRRWLAVWIAVALAGAAFLPVRARADGDPASDVLLVQNVFLPFQVQLSPKLQRALESATAQAKQAGYPIRVALIMQKFDLGAVPSLWKFPQTYADFLGQELGFVYTGRVLVVMPNGFGIHHGKASVSAEQRVLGGLSVGQGPDGMAGSALDAVVKLAAAAGHRLDVPRVTATAAGGHSSASRDRLVIGAAVLGAVLVAAAALLVRRRLRVRRYEGGSA